MRLLAGSEGGLGSRSPIINLNSFYRSRACGPNAPRVHSLRAKVLDRLWRENCRVLTALNFRSESIRPGLRLTATAVRSPGRSWEPAGETQESAAHHHERNPTWARSPEIPMPAESESPADSESPAVTRCWSEPPGPPGTRSPSHGPPASTRVWRLRRSRLVGLRLGFQVRGGRGPAGEPRVGGNRAPRRAPAGPAAPARLPEGNWLGRRGT